MEIWFAINMTIIMGSLMLLIFEICTQIVCDSEILDIITGFTLFVFIGGFISWFFWAMTTAFIQIWSF